MASLSVCQTSIIKDLKHDVEYVRVSFFNFIKQDYAIRFFTYKLSQVTAIIVTNGDDMGELKMLAEGDVLAGTPLFKF